MPPIATHDLVLSTKPFPSKLKVSETETHWNNWPNEKGVSLYLSNPDSGVPSFNLTPYSSTQSMSNANPSSFL